MTMRSRGKLALVDKADNSAGSKAEVVSRLRAHETEIVALGVKRLGLFGSFVRDEAGPDSDVDLLVEFEPGRKSFDGFMRLSDLLEDVLQRPVELVTTEALSPHIGPAILESTEYVTEAAWSQARARAASARDQELIERSASLDGWRDAKSTPCDFPSLNT